MPQFTYKAKTADGELKSGMLSAGNRAELSVRLKEKGLTLVGAEKMKGGKTGSLFKLPQLSKSVGLVDKMLFTRNLAVMLKAGLPFGRALSILSEQTKSKYFHDVLLAVSADVQRGDALADSLNRYPKVFNKLFVSMVRVGESSGNLEEVLGLLAIQLKKDHDLTSKVKGAMTYPIVILCAMGLVGVLMMVFVFPKLLNMFAESGAELPVATRMLILISEILQDYGLYLLAGLGVGLYLLGKWIKTKPGKRAFDACLLKLPLIGGIVTKVNVARFCRTLSSMVASGVSIVQALDTVSDTLGNTFYKETAALASAELQKGVELSGVISRYSALYPSMMIHMIEVGEETGSIEKTLKQVAEYYEDEVDQFTSNLSSIIEPILMLLMGGAVGLFAIALIQPMYSIMETIE